VWYDSCPREVRTMEFKKQLNIYEKYYIQKRDWLANIIHPSWILMCN